MYFYFLLCHFFLFFEGIYYCFIFVWCNFYFFFFFFFFKQKTAYERRISGWSADVCSSDLTLRTMMSRRPSQKVGIACPATARNRAKRSTQLFWRTAATIPSGIANVSAKPMERAARMAVIGKRLMMRSLTGKRK